MFDIRGAVVVTLNATETGISSGSYEPALAPRRLHFLVVVSIACHVGDRGLIPLGVACRLFLFMLFYFIKNVSLYLKP